MYCIYIVGGIASVQFIAFLADIDTAVHKACFADKLAAQRYADLVNAGKVSL